MLVPVIGIEVHVELKSQAKVFSEAKNAFSNDPNTNVDIIDLGYPGTLPKLNREVIDMALKAALAFHCEINQKMHFDRKNYFYPDLPKGYQITQADTPIGHDGYLEIQVNGYTKKIGIERIHIEEDTCKSIHSNAGTLLNYNRAGVPLIEIVSKPDIASPEEAMAYAKTLKEMLIYLDISDAKMEEGSMRCDTNISMHEEGEALGTKTEIKNISGINYIGESLRYEINRQTKLLADGEKIINETRRFDENSGTTILMRTKETGNDYRYFPEPDIPFVNISDEWLTKASQAIPLLPDAIRQKYYALGLNENNINTLIANRDLTMFLAMIDEQCDAITAANLLTGDVLNYLNKHHLLFADLKVNASYFIKLVNLITKQTLSSKQTKEVLPLFLAKMVDPDIIIADLGLVQINDIDALQLVIAKVIKANPDSVNDYKLGKERAIKFLMGQIMKETKGQVNPKLTNEMLISMLKTS